VLLLVLIVIITYSQQNTAKILFGDVLLLAIYFTLKSLNALYLLIYIIQKKARHTSIYLVYNRCLLLVSVRTSHLPPSVFVYQGPPPPPPPSLAYHDCVSPIGPSLSSSYSTSTRGPWPFGLDPSLSLSLSSLP
jgi:hypothetical protein